MKKVNILGTTYKVYLNVPSDKDPKLEGLFGYTSFHDKRIVVADIRTVPGWESADEVTAQDVFASTVRHEVIHAYLSESGLMGSSNSVNCWAMNEEMVDWFAIQMPKLIKTFRELGV
jgi:phytoene dehydrogenase-like protein